MMIMMTVMKMKIEDEDEDGDESDEDEADEDDHFRGVPLVLFCPVLAQTCPWEWLIFQHSEDYEDEDYHWVIIG